MEVGEKLWKKVFDECLFERHSFPPLSRYKFKLTESTSRSSKSWEKSISRFGLGIVDQFEWWLIFVVEIRVLIVCLRSKLRLVLIDIFSVRIRCAGPIRNLYFMLFFVYQWNILPFPNGLTLKKVDMACSWIFLEVDMVHWSARPNTAQLLMQARRA